MSYTPDQVVHALEEAAGGLPMLDDLDEISDILRWLSDEYRKLREDAERYRYQFYTGEWDYSDRWIGCTKDEVDGDIDALAISAREELPDART
jgi:hypothetical protein